MLMEYSIDNIEMFLRKVDNTFPVCLSQKQDLRAFSQKLFEKGTICATCENGEIISMVAGYTDNLTDNKAYISVVATVCFAQKKGLASRLIREFINVCKGKGIEAVHLYTDQTNERAITMYHKLGFCRYETKNEHRKEDYHLIYYI